MSTDQTQGNETQLEQAPDEMTMLKQRAKMMGIEFSNNIGIETLRQKIAAKMAGESEILEKTDTLEDPQPNPPLLQDPESPAPKKETLRQRLIRENMRLIRLRITNMDPKKKDLPGEIFTTGNGILGTVRKFVPYGEVTENGYHVPYCIYKMLKSRKFLNIRTRKDKARNGEISVEQSWAPEFALEVLDPLTPQELARLSAAQAAAGGLS